MRGAQSEPRACDPRSIRGASCGARAARLHTFAAIVRDYITTKRDHANEELRYYDRRHARSFAEAVRRAVLSVDEEGKRHDHQRRIPGAVLRRAWEGLSRARLVRARTFDQLHDMVSEGIGGIFGVGELLVYDVAHRIGVFRRLHPELVYLHAGTRHGARVLGLSGCALRKEDLPTPFRKLTCAEIEDCLCIYKRELRRIRRARA